jgi:hypothetical protein
MCRAAVASLRRTMRVAVLIGELEGEAIGVSRLVLAIIACGSADFDQPGVNHRDTVRIALL